MQETSIQENQNLEMKNNSYRKTGVVLLIIGIVLLIVTIVFLFFSVHSTQTVHPWEAVFLTNGQVYFGHIVKQTKTDIVLHDVYYIQIQQLNPKEGENGKQPSQQFAIVKLGQEMYGPENRMTINRNQVLFIEQLRKDSQVVQKIQSLVK